MAAVTSTVVATGVAVKNARDQKKASSKAARRSAQAQEQATREIEKARKLGAEELQAAQIKAAQDIQRATLLGEREIFEANQRAAQTLSRAITEPDGTLKPFSENAVATFQQTRDKILADEGLGGAAGASIQQAALQGAQIPGQEQSPIVQQEIQRQAMLAESAAAPKQQDLLARAASQGLQDQTQRARLGFTGQRNLANLIQATATDRKKILQGALASTVNPLLKAQEQAFAQTQAPADTSGLFAEASALSDVARRGAQQQSLEAIAQGLGEIFPTTFRG